MRRWRSVSSIEIRCTPPGKYYTHPPNTHPSTHTQYKNGGSLSETIAKLYKEGGVARFYQGLSVAVVQLPLSRFGDVAANAFVLAALESFDETRGLPIFVKTGGWVGGWVLYQTSTIYTSDA